MKSYTRLLNEIHPKAWMCDAEKFLGDSELSENAYLEIDYNIESIYNFPNILDYINPIGEIHIYDNGDQYVGALDSKGRFHGEGTYFWKDGSVYQGNWNLGMMDGKGIYFGKVNLPDAYCYMGEFKDDKYWGKGKLQIKNGQIFEGTFIQDRFVDGYIKYVNGSSYHGKLNAHGYNGLGVYTDKHGASYKGFWKNGFKSGEGIEIFQNKEKIKGVWEKDKLIKGTWYGNNGDIYIGSFKDYKFDGDGTYMWHTGEKYIGTWINGEMNGYGMMWDKKGKKYSGIWKNNVFQDKNI